MIHKCTGKFAQLIPLKMIDTWYMIKKTAFGAKGLLHLIKFLVYSTTFREHYSDFEPTSICFYSLQRGVLTGRIKNTNFEIFYWTRSGSKPEISYTRGERTSTRSSRRLISTQHCSHKQWHFQIIDCSELERMSRGTNAPWYCNMKVQFWLHLSVHFECIRSSTFVLSFWIFKF